jgi:outer membrane immunogenic protein
MMKRQLMATVSCLALTGAASAADIPARMPVKAPPPAVVQLWAGPYIGVNGGAVWHRTETDTTTILGTSYDSARTQATGGTFGGQVGYNWQSQNFVYGLEADANWISAKKSHQQDATGPGFTFLLVHTTKLTWLATARARGGIAFGRTLVYGTGGLAVGGVERHWNMVSPSCCDGVTSNKTRTGWTAGGGIEHFISNPHVTVKAEALYVDLGRTTASSASGYTSRFKNTAVVGRLGLNLKW